MIRLPLLLIGYLFGCVQTSFFYGKKQGLDIREHGSGNAGTTNALRVMGRKAGVIVFIGDMGKMILALLFTGFLFRRMGEAYSLLIKLWTAVGVILGHDFPFYMHFKGGKGIASTGGLMFFLDWRMTLFSFICFFGLTFLTKLVSLASCVMVTGDLILFTILILTGRINPGIMPVGESILIMIFIVVLSLIRHKENIARLLKGEEKPITL
ncbi:MAG: glycerol-3-phosphate 1-O-acyltransferase PlsY [Lachnospiraceae bacterium]|nr:glycerol-3-phosphate 1-O-acyltransferase PlsY [Lachnospiraceae bacterium]